MFRGYFLRVVDISALRGYYPHFVDISTFRGYYPHFVHIPVFRGYYPYFMDTIYIGHTMSYLAHNVCNFPQSFILVVDIIFGHIMSYLVCNIHPISHIILI